VNDTARINVLDRQTTADKNVDRCGLSAIMWKSADKLRKNADKLWT
jgi:hypothetical protein